MSAIDSWSATLVQAALEYLRDSNSQTSTNLKNAFNDYKADAVPHTKLTLINFLRGLEDTGKSSMVAIALDSCGSQRAAIAVLNPSKPVAVNSFDFSQVTALFTLLKEELPIDKVIQSSMKYSVTQDNGEREWLTQVLLQQLNELGILSEIEEMLADNICDKTPLIYLIKSLSEKRYSSWERIVELIFINTNSDVEKLKEIVGTQLPEYELGIAIAELQARQGDPIAAEYLLAEGVMGSYGRTVHVTPTSAKGILKLIAILNTEGRLREEHFRPYVSAAKGHFKIEFLEAFCGLTFTDLDARKELLAVLVSTKQHALCISHVKKVGIQNLDPWERISYLTSIKAVENIDLILELNDFDPILDTNYLLKIAGWITADRWEKALQIYEQCINGAEDVAKPNITQRFVSMLRGDELERFDDSYTIVHDKGVSELAKHHFASQNKQKAREVLLRGVERGYPTAAAMLIEDNPKLKENFNLVELASNTSSEFQKLHAVNLIKRGQLSEAKLILESLAYFDDEAIHMLIYVLGEDIEKWVNRLASRDVDFSATVYSARFKSMGLSMLPKSELETSRLHRLAEAEKLGAGKRKKAGSKGVEEKWICNEALLKENRHNWESDSCSIHKDNVVDFELIGSIEPITDQVWVPKREELLQNSMPFSTEKGWFVVDGLESQPLRPWQEVALQAWASHGRQGIIEAATGSGKSRVGVMAALEAIDDGFAVLIVVPKTILQQQWIHDYFLTYIKDRSIPIYTMGNTGGGSGAYLNPTNHLRPKSITVAVIDTASSIEGDLKLYSTTRVLLIADEVHNFSGESDRRVLHQSFERRLGLTATLEVPNGRYGVLANYFGGHPVYEYGFSQAVADKVISPFDLLMIRIPMLEAELEKYTAAYQEMMIYKRALLDLDRPPEVGDRFEKILRFFKSAGLHGTLIAKYEREFELSDKYLRESESKANSVLSVANLIRKRGFALIFCDWTKTCDNVEIILNRREVVIKVLKSGDSQAERKKYFDQFDGGGVQALVAPRILDEGVDIQRASIGFFAGTSRRRLQTIQRLGRVLRTHSEKHKPLIILPVGVGTEEDSLIPGNEDLNRSTFGEVYARADKKSLFEVSDQEGIANYIAKLE
jgi:superfamily II DNA or RNA helicase